ncbi:MAG TPA: ATP-dependent DNA helicase, partial [Gaiellaceae bacterium]|nr:ATP-dependent DNA helicase [Gaiellaceae bacterium]
TGTGKSLGYLVPALASGKRVVVATATKALQEQLLTKDVPAAAAALGRPVDVAVLKGRANYLCRKSLETLALPLFRTAEDAREYERLQDWIESTESGDRAELPFEPRPTLWAELAVGPDRCAGRRCPFLAACYSERARERAHDAELVIANHALYFADLALRAKTGDGAGVLPEHDAVVFDEAHRLEEAASAWFGGRVSLAGLRQLLRDVERACREASRAVPGRALAAADRHGEELLAGLDPGRGRRRLTAADAEAALEPAAAFAGTLVQLARGLEGGGDDLEAVGRRALGMVEDLDACLAVEDEDSVSWAEQGALAWAPVAVSGILREALWERPVVSVLVSATLEPRFLRRRLGLDEAREVSLDSPFDYGDQTLLYVPRAFPEPRSRGYDARVAEEVVRLCGLSQGRALVLTTSYRALEELAERAAPRIPYPVLIQGDAPRERLLERFRDEVDSVLMATQTFWQGVDVQGESLSLLVIDKLPFAAPNDPLVEARCERIAAAGGDWFGEYAVPSAILQLRQGFGRLIRGHADRGVVAILDPRLRTRAYGRRFLTALPPAPLVGELGAVAGFLGASERASA